MRALRVLLAGLPALVAALLGLAHPVFLTAGTAERWSLAHLLLLPVFPLVGLALVWLLRGDTSPLAWAARLSAYAWAVLYGALDAIAGIGAPHSVTRSVERGEPFPPIGDLYEVGDRLGALGARGLLLAGALTALALARRRGLLALLGGGLIVVGAELVRLHHVFPGRGVTGMLSVAAGTAVLAAVRERRPAATGRTGDREPART